LISIDYGSPTVRNQHVVGSSPTAGSIQNQITSVARFERPATTWMPPVNLGTANLHAH
jgi:hypothetical protein